MLRSSSRRMRQLYFEYHHKPTLGSETRRRGHEQRADNWRGLHRTVIEVMTMSARPGCQHSNMDGYSSCFC